MSETSKRLELNTTVSMRLTGNALGSEYGHQDYGTVELHGVRLVDEAWLARMLEQRDELLEALEPLAKLVAALSDSTTSHYQLRLGRDAGCLICAAVAKAKGDAL